MCMRKPRCPPHTRPQSGHGVCRESFDAAPPASSASRALNVLNSSGSRAAQHSHSTTNRGSKSSERFSNVSGVNTRSMIKKKPDRSLSFAYCQKTAPTQNCAVGSSRGELQAALPPLLENKERTRPYFPLEVCGVGP